MIICVSKGEIIEVRADSIVAECISKFGFHLAIYVGY